VRQGAFLCSVLVAVALFGVARKWHEDMGELQAWMAPPLGKPTAGQN
jgi:hypothetical protein